MWGKFFSPHFLIKKLETVGKNFFPTLCDTKNEKLWGKKFSPHFVVSKTVGKKYFPTV